MATPLQKRKLMGEINVVPYIDVMLVLLVIFMVTAPLLTQGIEVELPKAGAEPIDNIDDLEPLIVTVTKDGSLFLNVGVDDETAPVSGAVVVEKVGVLMRTNPNTPILVKADRAVEYGYVVGAMVLMQQGGATSVGFVTDPLESYPVPE